MVLRLVLGVVLLAGCQSAPQIVETAQPVEAPKPEPVEEPILKKRVLVLPFLNRTEYQDESLVRVALFDVQQAVSNSADLILVKETDLEDPSVLYSAGGEYSMKRIFQQARRVAATGVILGRVEDLQLSEPTEDTGVLGTKERYATARVNFQLWDVAAEREVFSRTATGEVQQERVPWLDVPNSNVDMEEGKEAVSRALGKILQRFALIAKKLAWVGRIARTELNRYFITGGDQTGIRPGQLLRVYEAATAVTDPMNGSQMGLAPGRFKGLLKVTQTFGPDSSIAVLHTGAGFREEDRVEMHNPDNT